MAISSLTAIDRQLAFDRPEYRAKLLPGATEEELNDFEARFAIRLPRAFRDLYRWRNGQPADCSESFAGNRMFVSLTDLVGIKEELDGMIGTDFEDPRWWRRGWVPFLHNGAGDYLCVDPAAEDGGTPGQLIEFWHDSPDRRVVCPGMEQWLIDLAKAMESGKSNLR